MLKEKILRIDPVIFACTTLLSIISIVVLFGARDASAAGTRNLIMQVAMTVLGLAVMLLFANVDFENLPGWLYLLIYGFSAALLVLVLIFGEKAGVNTNWIKLPIIGISVQPSEFIRASFILTFAKHLSLLKDDINKPLNVLLLALHAVIIFGLLLLTGDLGMVLVYVGIMIVMLFCAGFSLWYFLGGIGTLLLVFPFVWDILHEYQKKRILVGFNPDLDPLDKGLQQIQSRSCIAGGGIFGRGVDGAGSFETMYGNVTDFFFASYSEMFGLVGALVIIALMAVIVVRMIRLALRCRSPFSKLILAGVAGMIVVQTIENIGMCLCLLPVIGITLPFLSAGGSSVLSIYMIIGIAHSVAGTAEKRHRF